MKNKKKKLLISIVTPCLNEENNIDACYKEVKRVMSGLPNLDYEHIFCDNDSSDKTILKIKAIAKKEGAKVETFGSALKGTNYKDGNCNSWYVAEMAEKRAMSRAVLKLTGFYELGVFGEDESDNFKQSITIKNN